jgi:hypothetical protein
MSPKIARWSEYGAPRHKHWRTPSRRRSSIGPKILVAAVVVVAGVIGISGIYPQIIDSEWVQETSTHSQRVAHYETAPIPRRSGIVAEIPLPPRRAPATTGEAAVPPPVSEMHPSVSASEHPAADLDSAMTVADVPEAQAIGDPPAKPALPAAPGVRPAQRYVARAPVVKRRVVRTEHHRSYSAAYAQYGGGWGGWSGWPVLGSP